jgi:hypothetical protein
MDIYTFVYGHRPIFHKKFPVPDRRLHLIAKKGDELEQAAARRLPMHRA